MYYFAYSSNMNFHHMRRLCGWHFTLIGLSVLNGYEFGPDNRGYANIRPKPGSKVFGVLYELDSVALEALDEYDGYPHVFGRQEIGLEDEDGNNYTAWVYIEKPEAFGGDCMQEDFLKRVIAGAMQNHLPKEWIKFLSSFKHCH